jgi:hypothetical protein
VPTVAELVSLPAGWVIFGFFVTGAGLLVWGTASATWEMTQSGALALACGAAGLAAQLIRVLLKPVSPPSDMETS